MPEKLSLLTTTGELALGVLQGNAAAFLEHAPGARAGEDPEHVHQMRVATRRMRAALRLFDDVLPPQASLLNEELKWIAGQLGPVRDLDVQVRRLRESAVVLGISEALVPYGAWLEDERHQAQIDMAAAWQTSRYFELTEHLQGISQWVPDAVIDQLLLKDAPVRLRAAFGKLRKRASKLDEKAPAEELHAVRIRVKRLRYTVEFYEGAYAEPAQQLVQSIVTLQDVLGNLQDIVVSGQHIHAAIQTVAGAWPAETSLALGQILQYDNQRTCELRRAFPEAYKAVSGKKWQRLQKTARRAQSKAT